MPFYGVQGTQIEASVWRDLADRYYDLLEESKVCLHDLLGNLHIYFTCSVSFCKRLDNHILTHTHLDGPAQLATCTYALLLVLVFNTSLCHHVLTHTPIDTAVYS